MVIDAVMSGVPLIMHLSRCDDFYRVFGFLRFLLDIGGVGSMLIRPIKNGAKVELYSFDSRFNFT